MAYALEFAPIRFSLADSASRFAETSFSIDIEKTALIFNSAEVNWQPVSARQLGKDNKSIAAGEELKLSSLPLGIYELRVAVKDSTSNRIASHSMVFGALKARVAALVVVSNKTQVLAKSRVWSSEFSLFVLFARRPGGNLNSMLSN